MKYLLVIFPISFDRLRKIHVHLRNNSICAEIETNWNNPRTLVLIYSLLLLDMPVPMRL